jgi:hypothetical protein
MCGKKGWRSVALHCSLAHDLDKRQLRDLYAIPYTTSILTPTTAKRYATNMRDKLASGAIIPVPVPGHTNRRSVAVATYHAGRTWQHGTTGYRRYGCRCEICVTTVKEYEKARSKQRRAAAGVKPRHVWEHGVNGYRRHGCRCEICVTARKADRKRQWEQNRR